MNVCVHLYISPHLDDAVLSCGGRMWRQTQAGERVLVVTIFAGAPASDLPLSPFARALHALWGLADPVAARREEDAAALARLGAEGVYWPYVDCIYRQAADGRLIYDSEEALFGEVHPADGGLIAELAGRLRTLVAEQAVAIYAPLAVGRHVDHQIVRRAVEGLEGMTYYEDYPYAGKPGALEAVLGGELSISTLSPLLPPTGEGGIIPPPEGDGRLVPHPWRGRSGGGEDRRFPAQQWQTELVALSPQALEAKIAAIACYSSQFITLGWADAEEMSAAVRAFARQTEGDEPAERYWRHVEGTDQTINSRTARRT
jgi:LmbE family N-acetylglucosaminyl deacetylase